MAGEYKSSPVGQLIYCSMTGVTKSILCNGNLLLNFFIKGLKNKSFDILETNLHSFKPWGHTGYILLGESHLAFHTYPEYNTLVFEIYSCRGPKDAEPVLDYTLRGLTPKKILFCEKHEVPIND